MDITLDAFRALCASSNLHPRFLDLIRGMGYKFRPGDEHFMDCHCSTRPKPGRTENDDEALLQTKEPVSLEYPAPGTLFPDAMDMGSLTGGIDISYNLRYFEKHGREDLKDPWSCRQSVFYHSYSLCGDGISSWIVIQPPERWKKGLEDFHFDKVDYPLALHIRAISSATTTLWDYLEDISKDLEELVRCSLAPESSHPPPVLSNVC